MVCMLSLQAVAMREEMRHMKHDELEKEKERISKLEVGTFACLLCI